MQYGIYPGIKNTNIHAFILTLIKIKIRTNPREIQRVYTYLFYFFCFLEAVGKGSASIGTFTSSGTLFDKAPRSKI